MTTKSKKVFYIGFFLSVCVGFFMHSFYELSNYSRVVGLFSPINESPWEHLKLLFFPYLIFTIILYIFTKRNSKNILFGNFIAILAGMLLTISSFYTLHGALGTNLFFIDLLIYFFCTAVTYILCIYFIKNNIFSINNTIGFMLFILMILVFIICTFIPPRIPLFQDGLTKSFGLIHH